MIEARVRGRHVRWRRAAAWLWVLAAAGLGAGCRGGSTCGTASACDGCGAAVVRWRLVDRTSGERNSGCTTGAAPSVRSVDCVELVVTDGAGAPVACPSCRFPCGPLEGTTQFALPAGTDGRPYQFAVRALRCGRPIGSTPPPVLRMVRSGEVTNLGAVEILVASDELDACDGGAGSASCCGS